MPLAIGGFGSGIGGDDATDSDTASESQSGKLTIPDSLVKALADFARILAFEERICGVYEAHERVIELLEAGAPLFPESEYSLASMAYALEECVRGAGAEGGGEEGGTCSDRLCQAHTWLQPRRAGCTRHGTLWARHGVLRRLRQAGRPSRGKKALWARCIARQRRGKPHAANPR